MGNCFPIIFISRHFVPVPVACKEIFQVANGSRLDVMIDKAMPGYVFLYRLVYWAMVLNVDAGRAVLNHEAMLLLWPR